MWLLVPFKVKHPDCSLLRKCLERKATFPYISGISSQPPVELCRQS